MFNVTLSNYSGIVVSSESEKP